jgi:penicillin-binding protein
VEQNTNAYATFANGGKYVDSYLIDRIETADGEIIYEHEPIEVDVFSPQTSYLTLDMLRDVLKPGGTASTLPGRLNFSSDWAGKTGTSNKTRDSWFVGTNPNVTLGVWIGYDQSEQISSTVNGLRYGPRTQQIWANIANAAYGQQPNLMDPDKRFARPDGIVSRSICSLTGLLPSKKCQEAGFVKTDLFNAKFVPSKTDDSLDDARYVTINGKNYLALSSTPSEFTEEGFMVSDDLLGIKDISRYLPDNLKNLITDEKAPNNGRTPDVVKGITLKGKTLSWSKHSDNDIVGYRIYRAKNESTNYSLAHSVKGNEETSFSVKNDSYSYYVTAVDSEGRESSASSLAEGSNYVPEPEPEPEENEKENEKESNNEEKDKKKKEEKDEQEDQED